MRNTLALLLTLLILLLPSFGYSAQNQNKVIASNDIFTAKLSRNSGCAGGVGLDVEAKSVKYFSSDSNELTRFVKMVKAKLNKECGAVRSMKVWGFVRGGRVYEAYTNASMGWKLRPANPDRFKKYTPLINIKSKASRAHRPSLFSGQPWSRANNKSAQRGEYGITITKNINENSPYDELNLMVSSRRRGGPETSFRFGGNLYATCSQLIEIQGFGNVYILDFDKFLKTGKGYDLPPEVIDGFYIARDALLEHCPDLKVIRVVFNPQKRVSPTSYTGTMTADSGWDLLDGMVETAYDSAREVKLKGRDPVRPVGIDYRGTCEPNPILPLKTIYYNEADEVWSKPLKLPDYTFFARGVAKQFAKECPEVQNIRFSCDPMPQGYKCVKGSDPCYLTWTPDNPDHIDSSQMEPKDVLNDYKAVIKAFVKGDKETLDDYEEFVRMFHNDFLEVFSNNCRGSIRNPRKFTIKTIETRYDQDGFEENSREVGATQTVYVASEYANRFDIFYGKNQAYAAVMLMNQVLNNQSGRGGSRALTRSVSYFINNIRQIEEYMSSHGCRSTEVQTIYENLGRYFQNQPLKVIELDVQSKKTSPGYVKKPPVDETKVPPEIRNQNFADDLVLSPALNDILLARYYPGQLSQRMMEAMISSRWGYEQYEKKPLGGRFFAPGHTPKYSDLKRLTGEFKEWLLSRAEILPKELILDVPLLYSQNTFTVQNNCLHLIQPPNAPKRLTPNEKLLNNRKIKKCESENQQKIRKFEECKTQFEALKKAEQKLAELEANGCKPIAKKAEEQKVESNGGPCNFTQEMSFSDIQNEFNNCIIEECGTFTPGNDVKAYQDCIKRLTEHYKNAVNRKAGVKPQISVDTNQQKPCRTVKRKIREVKQQIKWSMCDKAAKAPELQDCAALAVKDQSDDMQVLAIEWSHMPYCSKVSNYYNRTLKESAGLLPNLKPYSDMQYVFRATVDKLSLPYDIPIKTNKSWGVVNARIKIELKGQATELNTTGTFDLKAQIKGLEFEK